MSDFEEDRRIMEGILSPATFAEYEDAEGRITFAVFLDIRRASDTASHSHAVHERYARGIKGRPLHWVADFLRRAIRVHEDRR